MDADTQPQPIAEQPFTVEGGTVVLPLADTRLLLTEHTVRLDAAMRGLARKREVALLAVTPDDLRSVDMRVPPLWLKKSLSSEFRLRAVAVVTHRPAVRAAAMGFGQANRLLKIELAVEVFRTEAEARTWLQGKGFLDP